MARPSIDDDVHNMVKKFAADNNMTVKQAYKFIVKTLIDKNGKPKEDFEPLKDLLEDFNRFLG